MASTFGTYSVAYSGMYVNQAALTATSTNLANVDTTGASKVQVTSAAQNTVQSSGASTGNGVSVASITRSRDIFLDSTYRSQNASATYDSVKSGNLEYIDKILSEYDTNSTTDTTTTTSGVQEAVNTFFNAWGNLSTDSSTTSTRVAVTTAASDLVTMLSDIDDQLQQLQADAVTGVQDGVDSLNDLAGQVADLNTQITQAEVGGGEASCLRDQRDVLLDQMSALADISVTTGSNGTLKVTLNGSSLVNGTTVNTLVVAGSGTTTDPLKVKWTDSDDEVTIKSGSIAAYMEDTDQTGYETIDASDIPYNFTTTATSSITTMRQALNDLITTIATKVNSLSTSGVDLNGNTGVDFFTTVDSSQPLSISNIQVNPELVKDSNKVVTSSSGADGDNTIASAIKALATDTTCYKNSESTALNVTQFYTAVTKWIGTAGDTATSNYTTQAALVEQLDNQRQSVSGISIDEEMSNMIKFQNAYAASARVMSTIDSLLGDLLAEFD
ncbi:flagellar hook-associated protein FlgK [Pelosinus sp. IPA-1]|uniref:flagellar hook-associated protein FlgK n=1 Tax=Pelosinus sp. IPA-1 TaxID=3029569 RepID=UPI0024361AEE|nr:flagellar hook-associated protein FlgK [Pelosinus sp. IPA-1]GMB01211.1 flagellar hook-associated protein 1 [Pelosinus sp. IPA-1]